MTRVYLDHHAATPPVPAARAAMEAALGAFANPASVHAEGRAARAVFEKARDSVAAALGAHPADVVLTSGGTEAVNLAVLGLAHARKARHVVTTAVEHPAVARSVGRLEREGARVTRLAWPVTAAALGRALADGADLVAMQWVSHETGAVLPVAECALVCRTRGVALAVDATQAVGKLPVDAAALGADALALASHKLGGPAGAGAVVVARGVQLEPVLEGGAQERGRRPGSPDVVAAAGFGGACGALSMRLDAMPRVARLRDTLERGLVVRGAVVNGADGVRVATATNVSFRGLRGDLLVAALDVEGVAAASGAACSSGLAEPSPVLRAMFPAEPWRAESALRLTLGPETTDDDVARALAALDRVLARAAT